MGLRRVPVDKLMAPGATCQLEWVHSLARKGRNLSTGMCRLEGAYSVHWDVLDDEEGEQEYDDELGQGCATLSVIGRGSDPSWVTSVGHFLLGVGHFLPVVVVVVVVDGVFIQAIFSMDNALMLVDQTVGGTFPSLLGTCWQWGVILGQMARDDSSSSPCWVHLAALWGPLGPRARFASAKVASRSP